MKKIYFNPLATIIPHNLWCSVLIFLLCSLKSFAQNSAILEAYIKEGLDNNLALQQHDLDLQKATEAIQQAKGLFHPTLSFNANYTRALGGRKIDFPIGDLLNPVYSTLNQLTQSSAFPSVQNAAIQLLPDNFHETKFKFAYPIYNVDLKLNRTVQEQDLLTKRAKKAIYEHELRYEITAAYLQLLKATEAEKIWVASKDVLNELLRFNQSLVKNNVATKDIVATAEYEITKADNEIYQLKSLQSSARSYLNFLVNKDLQAPVALDTALLKGMANVYSRSALIESALNKRREFEALRLGISTLESVVKAQKLSGKRPDLYLGGEFGFQGFGYKFDKNQAFVLAQIGLTYDIFDGHQLKSKTRQNNIEIDKLKNQYTQVQQQIALQVTKAYNDYDAARNAWQSAQVGIKAAESSFRIINNKYRANQALLIEYLEAQNRVTTARMQVLLAWADVLIKEADLRKVSGED